MQCNIIFLQQPYSPGISTSRACESYGLNTTGCFNDKGQDWHALTVQRYSISNKTSSSRLHSTLRSQHSKQATSTSKTSETGNNPNIKTKLHKTRRENRIIYQNSSKPAQRTRAITQDTRLTPAMRIQPNSAAIALPI